MDLSPRLESRTVSGTVRCQSTVDAAGTLECGELAAALGWVGAVGSRPHASHRCASHAQSGSCCRPQRVDPGRGTRLTLITPARLPPVRRDGGGRRRRWRRRSRRAVEVRDVDADPELQARYTDEVPVLLINGRKAFKYRVTPPSCAAPAAEAARELAERARSRAGRRWPRSALPLCRAVALGSVSHRPSMGCEPATMPTIAVDAMGGELAPEAIVQGVADVSLHTDIECVLVGDEARIQTDPRRRRLQSRAHRHRARRRGDRRWTRSRSEAVRRKRDASLLVGLPAGRAGRALRRAGDAPATPAPPCWPALRALPAASRRAQGGAGERLPAHGRVPRPGPAGAAARRRRDRALRGARARAVRASWAAPTRGVISKVDAPRVGAAQHGARRRAGRRGAGRRAPPAAPRCRELNFVGNIEGHELTSGRADVVVCEGLLGNVVLKLLESVADDGRSTSPPPRRSATGAGAPAWRSWRAASTACASWPTTPPTAARRSSASSTCSSRRTGARAAQAIANAVKVAAKAVRDGVVAARSRRRSRRCGERWRCCSLAPAPPPPRTPWSSTAGTSTRPT